MGQQDPQSQASVLLDSQVQIFHPTQPSELKMVCSCHLVLGETDVQEVLGHLVDQEHLVLHQFPEDHADQVFLLGLSLPLVLEILEVLQVLDVHVCLLQ